MLIGELADALDVPTETVRFYERRGLLPEPARAKNGYRIYDEQALARLRFIRSAQTAGLTLAEIGGIVATTRRNRSVHPRHRTIESKLEGVKVRRRQLAALETEIEALIERSHHLNPADCTDTDICHILNTGS